MGRINRRSFLTMASIGGGSLLAGCTGGSDSSNQSQGGSGGDSGSGSGSNGSDNGSGSSGGSKPYSGVTIKFWDHLGSFSQEATNTIQRVTKEFESDTGATVKTTSDGPGALGSKWPQAMTGGDVPHLHTYNPAYSGSVPTKFWKSFSELRQEYSGKITDKKLDSMSTAVEHMEFAARGMDDDLPHAPVLHVPRSPVLTRHDFFEQAGVADRMPPKSFDDLVDVAKTVQENSDAKAGYQIPGDPGDYFGFVGPHAVMAGGRDGAMLNEDASEHNLDDDSFLTAIQRIARLRDEGLFVDNTAALSGDAILGNIGSGDYAMVTTEPKFQPTAMSRNQGLMEDGSLQWVPNWETESGQLANNQIMLINVTPPQGDSNKAQKRHEAAVDFLANYWLSKDFHVDAASGTGFIPTREDTWEAAEKQVKLEGKHHWFRTCTELLENTDTLGLGYGRPDEGLSVIPALGAGGEPIQKVILGEYSPKKAQQEWISAAEESYS